MAARLGLRALNGALAGLARRRRAEDAPDPRRVVVHLIGNVGDIVVAIPALIALRERWPDADLTFLTSPGQRGAPGAAQLLEGVSFLDAMIVYHQEDIARRSDQLRLVRRIAQLRADLLVYLPQSRVPPATIFRNLAFARLTGAARLYGYYVPAFPRFRLAQARVNGRFPQEVDRHLTALAPLLGGVPSEARFELGVPTTADRAEIEVALKAADGRPIVAVCPGGKQGGHLWPAERFATVASALAAEGSFICTIGGPGDRGAGAMIAAASGGRQLAGALTLLGSAAFMRSARAVLTNDTGPMHLAAAVGTSCVAIFSSQNFAGRWYPYGPGHEVLRAREVCEVCLFNETQTLHCVGEIDPATVLAAARRALTNRT